MPIAVIGMSCRFPGVNAPEAFVRLLRTGGLSVGPVPASRLALWGEAARVTAAGLLDDIAHFDRTPFRISANEAPLIDPMQRLALEGAWTALEDAGLSPGCLDGVSAGVFMGASTSDYAIRMAKAGVATKSNPHLLTAAQNGAISGRVSYCLGLSGPSLTLDTACSSALAAVALACDALRLGQCDFAVAGGVNALLSAESFEVLAMTNLLSSSGATRSFDAQADGFVRSEGCGMVVLKRLCDATAQGDRVHAVLQGWATGHNGRSNGLSAPARAGQVQVISAALRAAGMGPNDIGAIEAHGSGTALADTIEAAALAEVFAGRSGPPGALGSVKASLGHLEAAGGIAGLIKAILMVRDGFVPVQPAFCTPSPRIDWAALPFAVPRITRAWTEDRRVVGVSAFGMSGLNAHVIVGAADTGQGAVQDAAGPYLFLLSAATSEALSARAAQLLALLQAPEVDLGSLAAAVSRRWAGMSLRAEFLAGSIAEAQSAVRQIISEPPRTAARVTGKIILEAAEGLCEGDRMQLGRIFPDLVSGADADARRATTVCPETDGGRLTMAEAVLALHRAGARILPQRMEAGDAGRVDLPGYPFCRQRYWYDTLPGQAGGASQGSGPVEGG